MYSILLLDCHMCMEVDEETMEYQHNWLILAQSYNSTYATTISATLSLEN